MSAQSSTECSRFRLRLTVRAMMLVVLIAGGSVGWVMYRARVQRDSVIAIQRAGGTVLFDWQWRNSVPAPAGSKLWAPNWLVDQIGADYFQHVTYVSLPTCTSSQDLVHIGNFGQLEMLLISGTGVSDEGLARLKGLNRLQVLNLLGTKVGDAGIKNLEGLAMLKSLNLKRTDVTDAGMVHLKELLKLEDLDLDMTKISDAGLAHLVRLRSLRELGLQMTAVTDAGLVILHSMTNLQQIRLRSAKITRNSSLGELARALPNLRIEF
jgi:hypothetical protein